MATLKLKDGTTYTSLDDTARELAPLNVQLKRWLIGDNLDTEKHFRQAADLETN